MSAAGPARRAAVTRDDWETPPDLFERLNAEFEFTLDAAANAENRKCVRYWDGEAKAEVRREVASSTGRAPAAAEEGVQR